MIEFCSCSGFTKGQTSGINAMGNNSSGTSYLTCFTWSGCHGCL